MAGNGERAVRGENTVTIALKRAYEPPSPEDGTRVLVERLWPRGLSKESAHIDLWLREVAPSVDLRRWYAHDPARYDEFRARYLGELGQGAAAEGVRQLRGLVSRGPVTLVFATKDPALSSAAILRDVLRGTVATSQG